MVRLKYRVKEISQEHLEIISSNFLVIFDMLILKKNI